MVTNILIDYFQRASSSITNSSHPSLPRQDSNPTLGLVFDRFAQPAEIARELPCVVSNITKAVAQLEQLTVDELKILRINLELLPRISSVCSPQTSIALDYTAAIAEIDYRMALSDTRSFFSQLEQIQVPDGYFILQDGRRLPIYSEYLKHLGAFESVLATVDSSEIREGIPYPFFEDYLSPDEAEKFMVATYTENCAGLWNEESVGRWLAAADILASPKIKREAAQWILKHLSAQSVESFYRQAKEINHPIIINLCWYGAEKREFLTKEMINDYPHLAPKLYGDNQRFFDTAFLPVRRNLELLRSTRESEEKSELKPQHCLVNIGGKQLVMDKMVCLSFPPLAGQLMVNPNQSPLTLPLLQSEDAENFRELLYTGQAYLISSASASRLQSLFEPYVYRKEIAQIACRFLQTDDDLLSLIPSLTLAHGEKKMTALLDMLRDKGRDFTIRRKILISIGRMGDFAWKNAADAIWCIIKDEGERYDLRLAAADVLAYIWPREEKKGIEELITLISGSSTSDHPHASDAMVKLAVLMLHHICERHDIIQIKVIESLSLFLKKTPHEEILWAWKGAVNTLIDIGSKIKIAQLQTLISQTFIDILQSPTAQPNIQEIAAKALYNIVDKIVDRELQTLVLQALIHVVQNSAANHVLRCTAALALGDLGVAIEQEAVEALTSILRDPSVRNVRDNLYDLCADAVSALSNIGVKTQKRDLQTLIVLNILPILEDSSYGPRAKASAARALGKIGSMIEDRGWQTIILQKLMDKAKWLLTFKGSYQDSREDCYYLARDTEIEVNEDDLHVVHYQFTDINGNIEHLRRVHLIKDFANGIIMMGLAMGEHEAEALIRLILNNAVENPWANITVATALGSIGPATLGKGRIDALIDIIRNLGANSILSSQAAVRTLGRIGPAIGQDGMDALINIIKNLDERCRGSDLIYLAARALSQMGPSLGQSGVDALIAVLENSHENLSVRAHAAKALINIGVAMGIRGMEALAALFRSSDFERQNYGIASDVARTLVCIGSALGERGTEIFVSIMQDRRTSWQICEIMIETFCNIRPTLKKDEIQQIITAAKNHYDTSIYNRPPAVKKCLRRFLYPEVLSFSKLI